MTDFPEFILASQSPRRRELLQRAGYRFGVIPPGVDEHVVAFLSRPAAYAEAVAHFKAAAVFRCHRDRVVLGADTVVAQGNRLFGKAGTPDEARAMLAALAGTRQEVITGVAVLLPDLAGGDASPGPRRLLASDTTIVTMRPMTPAEIDAYVASGEWQDKAGAYAIQETADRFIERVEGSFTNVVGLPMELLERLFDKAMTMLAGGSGMWGATR
jgi:septum formation protein